MKIILLDENLPAPLKNDLKGAYQVYTIHDKGWQSKQNGELLQSIDDEGIDYLMTADRNLEFQQNLNVFNGRLIVLLTHDIRYETIKIKMAHIMNILSVNESTKDKVIKIDLRDI